MAIDPKNGFLTAGVAGGRSETINPSPDPLTTGDVPQLFATDEVVAASQTLAALTVVGFNSSGALVKALIDETTPANTIDPIGILVYAVTTAAGETTKHAGVYRGGVFNPNLLVWDASFDTDAKKRAAFEGAPSPTQIVIRAPKTLTV